MPRLCPSHYKVSEDGLKQKELDISSFVKMKQKPNDQLTPHHMPAAKSIEQDNILHNDGSCLNVREDTHTLTFTFGLSEKN